MNDSLPSGPADPDQGTAPGPSLIGENLRVRGILMSDGAVLIEGTVNGDVRVASIVIGETGSVTGNVLADTIVVHGFVNGNIEARTVELVATAHVIGDTTHRDLRVERGACLDGNYRTMGKSRRDPAVPTPKAAAKGRRPGP